MGAWFTRPARATRVGTSMTSGSRRSTSSGSSRRSSGRRWSRQARQQAVAHDPSLSSSRSRAWSRVRSERSSPRERQSSIPLTGGYEIEAATADLIAALAGFNHDLNGSVPSERIAKRSDSVPRTVAYAVAESIRMLREAGAVERAEDAESAWLAVLSGDIDDVTEHVALERRSRSGS